MASLLSLMRKGKIRYPLYSPLDPSEWNKLFTVARRVETIHVRADSVAADLPAHIFQVSKRSFDWHDDLEDVTPPFQVMWMEALVPYLKHPEEDNPAKARFAALVQRLDVTSDPTSIPGFDKGYKCGEGPYRHALGWRLFTVFEEQVQPVGHVVMLTDLFGQPAWMRLCDYMGPLHDDQDGKALSTVLWVFMEAIVRMNTQNVVLVPITSGRKAPKPKFRQKEACVWHEIVIRPEVRIHEGDVPCCTAEAIERREHWVRGHRKDYRKGAGLFGKIRSLVWIPEHKRGDPALGIEVPEYRIE